MASAAAQQYFNSFSPAEQAQIKASWGGSNLLEEWFKNAVSAGAVPASGPQPGRQDGKNWNWTVDPAAAQRAWRDAGSPATPDVNAWFKNAVEAGAYTERGDNTTTTAYELSGFSGGPDITGMRAWAKQHGMSEDYDRWSEGQLMAWEKQKSSGCPPNAPYMAYDGSGCVEKPIDTAGGGAKPAGGAGGVTGGTGTTGGGQSLSNTYSPLRDLLANQGSFLGQFDPTRGDGQAGVRGGAVGGGGIWWQPTGQTTTSRLGTPQSVSAPNSVGWNNPNITQGAGLAGPQSWGGAGASSTKAAPMGTPQAVGWNNPNITQGAPLGGAQSWGGSGTRPGTSSLESMLVPYQSQSAPQNALMGAVMPFQARRPWKDPLTTMLSGNKGGSWF